MLADGSGEFRGTSITRIPAWCSRRPVSTARVGSSPRRIATSAAESAVGSNGMGHQLFSDLSKPRQGGRGAVDCVGLAMAMAESLRVQVRQVGRADEVYCRQLPKSLEGTGDVAGHQQPGKVRTRIARGKLAGQRPAAAFKQPVQHLGTGKACE